MFIFLFGAGYSFPLYCFEHGPQKKSQNISQRKGRENYTSPTRTANEGLQLAHTEYYQPPSKEPYLLEKDTTDETMDLALPSTTLPCRPNSPIDLTDRATDDSSCRKLQSIAYYIHLYEFFTEQAKNAIKVLIENGFTDPNDPEMQRKYQDVEYYTQRHYKAFTISFLKLTQPLPIQLRGFSLRFKIQWQCFLSASRTSIIPDQEDRQGTQLLPVASDRTGSAIDNR
ncbi:hypothetical protein TNCV_4551771 [Trichonephila clavipes]|nr:hypothetical protein TNCV_4551771 [Trichonephila clavipes]